ncbi:MAG: hypothetical protein AB7T06_10400 [Kofleriaceae bacterium]
MNSKEERSIEWLANKELERRLQRHPPVGLRLYPFLQGTIDADLTETLSRPPQRLGIDGLGNVLVWSGVALDVPFTIAARSNGARMGFEIAFPARIRDGRLDVMLLDIVDAISPRFAEARSLYVEHLPFVGAGFGVVENGDVVSAFRSRAIDDAKAVAAFFDRHHRGRWIVIPTPPAAMSWIVVGPIIGNDASRLEVFTTRQAAEDAATRWQKELGATCAIHEGELPS